MTHLSKQLDEARKIFLVDVDDETRLDNEQKIAEWEKDIRENEAIADWREHDITKLIAQQARETYRDLAVQLAVNRSLTQEHRQALWGKQDACLFILSLTDKDAVGRLKEIEKEIARAITTATN